MWRKQAAVEIVQRFPFRVEGVRVADVEIHAGGRALGIVLGPFGEVDRNGPAADEPVALRALVAAGVESEFAIAAQGDVVSQLVVLFPSAKEANAFFTTSTQRWPACANRQGTIPGDADNPEIQWTVGAVANTNGVLSTPTTVTASKNGSTLTQNCQRALTVRNNVVIDVDACRKDPGDLAVTIANQIAGKVDKQ